MSAIASFTVLPAKVIEGLRDTRVSGDKLRELISRNGEEVADYQWSGWVFGTLLPYLEEERGIALTADHTLTEALGSVTLILTPEHKALFLGRTRRADFSEVELRDYYNEFNESDEPGIGEAMLDGIDCLHQSLAAIEQDLVVVVQVG